METTHYFSGALSAPERLCPETHCLAQEHGALLRQMATLQARVSGQLQAHAQQVVALEGEVVRLRGPLVVVRSCLLWGLPHERLARVRRVRDQLPLAPSLPTVPFGADLAQASEVICQTGCVGQAHPWLENGGQCRRTGLVCGPLAAAKSGGAGPVLPMVVDLKR